MTELSTRDTILLEAKLLFRENGYSAVSINDILEKLSVKKPTIYHYFKDKENLFTEVLIDMLHKGGAFIPKNLTESQSIEASLEHMAIGFFQHSPTALASMMRDSSVHLSEANQARVRETLANTLLKPFINIFKEGISSGRFPKTSDPVMLSMVFVTWLDTFTALYRHQHGDTTTKQPSDEQLARHAVQQILNGIGKA
jgi:AcrR family transcriptional regulator